MTESEFREKVLSLRHLMYGIALRLDLTPDDAADAVQETQIRLWRNRDKIPIRNAEIRLYCLASMRNECLSRLRSRKPMLPTEEFNGMAAQEEHRVESEDTCRHIESMIARLPAAQKQVIRLSAFGQLETREIAQELQQSEANVRQLLSRGRKRLRDMMDKFMNKEKSFLENE